MFTKEELDTLISIMSYHLQDAIFLSPEHHVQVCRSIVDKLHKEVGKK